MSEIPWRARQPIASRCAWRERLRHEHVVVDGRRRSGGSRARAAGTRSSPAARGAPAPSRARVSARTPAPSARSAVTGERSKTDAPGRLGRAREAPAQPRRVDERGGRRATTPRRGTSASRPARAPPRRRAARRPSRSAAAARPPPPATSSWCGSVATSIAPVSSQPHSIPWRATVARIAARFSRPIRSSASISPGQRARPFADPVRQRRRAEAAVATRRAERDPLALEQHDALALLGRLQRGPQPGQPAADHDEVGLDRAVERRAYGGGVGLVEPERPRRCVRDQESFAITCLICV